MQLPEATNYQQPPTGTHSAICIGFYDLGTHPNEYQGVTSMKHQVFIRWELPEEQMDDGRPFTIGQFYTWSMSENAKLRAHLEAWRNKPFEKADFGKGGFDTRKLLGVPCTLVVTENEKGKARVTSVGPKMKGLEPRQPENELVYVALTQDAFDEDALEKLSEKMRDMVRQSPEYRKLTEPQASYGDARQSFPADLDDEIPF